jgi:hypothetical protein
MFRRGKPVSPAKPALITDRFFLFAGLIACVVASAASISAATFVPEPRPFLGLCLPIAFGLVSVPLAFTFAHSRFVQWAYTASTFLVAHGAEERSAVEDKKIQQWVLGQLSFFNVPKGVCSKGACATAIILAAWTLLSFYLGDYFSYFNLWQRVFVGTLMTLSAFLAGLGLHAIFQASRLICRLGDGRYRIVVKSHKFGILGTGRMLLECYFVIALVCAVYYLSAITGERSLISDLKFWNPPLWMLSVPTAVFVLSSFIICQIPLHKQMIRYKRDKLAKIERRLDELKAKSESSLTTALSEEIKLNKEEKLEILSLPEWPFGLKGTFAAILSSVTVVLPHLVSLIPKLVEGHALPALKLGLGSVGFV